MLPKQPNGGAGKTLFKFSVLASSSSGNSIFVGTEKTRVLVDAGLSRKELESRLAAIGEQPGKLDAILITHEHADHISGLGVLARKYKQATIYATHLTASAIDWSDIPSPRQSFQAGTRFAIGDLEISSFTIPHDAVDPVGYSLQGSGVRASIVTDLGYMPDSIKMHLRGSDILLLESNHNVEMLKVGPYPWALKQRIMGRKGHLSNEAAYEFLVNDMDQSVRRLLLGHLSEHNNFPTLVEQMAHEALAMRAGCQTTFCVAEPGVQCQPIEF